MLVAVIGVGHAIDLYAEWAKRKAKPHRSTGGAVEWKDRQSTLGMDGAFSVTNPLASRKQKVDFQPRASAGRKHSPAAGTRGKKVLALARFAGMEMVDLPAGVANA